jgi:hypothetical protein
LKIRLCLEIILLWLLHHSHLLLIIKKLNVLSWLLDNFSFPPRRVSFFFFYVWSLLYHIIPCLYYHFVNPRKKNNRLLSYCCKAHIRRICYCWTYLFYFSNCICLNIEHLNISGAFRPILEHNKMKKPNPNLLSTIILSPTPIL